MLDESQSGIRRNINNLRNAGDVTITAENEEDIKSLLMRMKEDSEKADLKLNIRKQIMASGPINSWQIDGETVETDKLYFGGLQNHCRR